MVGDLVQPVGFIDLKKKKITSSICFYKFYYIFDKIEIPNQKGPNGS